VVWALLILIALGIMLYAGSLAAWALVRLAFAAACLFISLIVLAFTALAYWLSPTRPRGNRHAA